MMEKLFHSSLIWIFNLGSLWWPNFIPVGLYVVDVVCEIQNTDVSLQKRQKLSENTALISISRVCCVCVLDLGRGFKAPENDGDWPFVLRVGICLNYKHATDIKLMNNDGYMMRCGCDDKT